MGLLKDLREGNKMFGDDIASLINFVLLTVVYFLGVGITSIIAKISGKRFLELKKREDSYWSKLNLGKLKKKEYFRQF